MPPKPHFNFADSDIAKRYDQGRCVSDASRASLVATLREAAPSKVARVLDMGGGTGRFITTLAEAFQAPVVVVEPAANMLSVAVNKLRVPSTTFVQASAHALPFAAQSFDFVFVSQVLHHLTDLPAVMGQVRRVLTIQGRLFVRQSTLENLDSYFYQLFFPEARAIDEARLPEREQIGISAESAGLVFQKLQTVRFETGTTGRQYLEKVATRTNTDLAMLSDEAFSRGFDRFAQFCRENPHLTQTEEIDYFVFSVR